MLPSGLNSTITSIERRFTATAYSSFGLGRACVTSGHHHHFSVTVAITKTSTRRLGPVAGTAVATQDIANYPGHLSACPHELMNQTGSQDSFVDRKLR